MPELRNPDIYIRPEIDRRKLDPIQPEACIAILLVVAIAVVWVI